MEQLARKEPAFRCFIDPDAPEFASAGEMPEMIRNFCSRTGQHIPDTDGALVRCIYESLAMKYRYAIAQISANTGKRFEVLHLLGGGTKDSFLCQMTANALCFGVIAGPTEATALGNILLQLIALGELPDLNAGRAMIRMQEAVKVYTPEPSDELEAAYEAFCKLL